MSPPLSQQLLFKTWDLLNPPPLFAYLVGGPTPKQKGGDAHNEYVAHFANFLKR